MQAKPLPESVRCQGGTRCRERSILESEQARGTTLKGTSMNPLCAGCNVYGRHESGDTRVKESDEWMVVPGMREPW